MNSLRVHRVNFFNPEPRAIRCISYDKTNSRIAVSRSDSSIEIWDLKGNPFLEKIIPGSSAISVEALSWCNGRLFSAGLYGYITEHDLTTLLPKYQLVVTSGCTVWCMKANGSKCLATGNEDGHVVLHQLTPEGLDFDKKFDKQEGAILCLDWHVDGQIIVTGSIDAIRIWNVDTGHVANRILLGRASKSTPTIVWCIAITKDMTIISGDSCGKTSFWDGNTGTLLSASGTQNEDVLALSVNEEEDVMYKSGVDSTITMYMKAHANGKWLKSIQRIVHTHDVRALQLAGDYLVSGGDDCNLVFTKYPPKTTIQYFPFCQKSYTMTISDPLCILLQYSDCIEVWSLVDPLCSKSSNTPCKLLRVKPKEEEKVISSSISSNGKWLAYCTQFKVRLFCIKLDTESPAIHKVYLPDEVRYTSNLLFTSEPTNLILYAKSKIFIIKCDSMQPTVQATIETNSDFASEIHLMELSSSNIYLACGCHDGNIIIYDLSSLKIYSKLPLYECQPTALKFDPSSENLIAVYSDRKVVEYNLKASAYSSWCKQEMLHRFQEASLHPIISIGFQSSRLFFQDENAIYVFDRMEVHQPEKKRKRVTKNSFTTKGASKLDSSFKTINKYEHISNIHTCLEHLVLVHHSSNRILNCLPPPIWKKKYGT